MMMDAEELEVIAEAARAYAEASAALHRQHLVNARASSVAGGALAAVAEQKAAEALADLGRAAVLAFPILRADCCDECKADVQAWAQRRVS